MLLQESKSFRIQQSKDQLQDYIQSHPLIWTDGKAYTVTQEKQTQLLNTLTGYQITHQLYSNEPLYWNAAGEESTIWDYSDLCKLASAIEGYIHTLVEYQRQKEAEVNACETEEEVTAVIIDFYCTGAVGDWSDMEVPKAELTTASERLTELEKQTGLAKAQIEAQTESLDMLEGCLTEMAEIVYE